jgi:alanine racemase
MKKKFLQWVEVDSEALKNNLSEFRRLIGKDRLLLATVKANAYGHGLEEVSRIVLQAGADWLGVHTLEEGIELRRSGMKCPILVLGYVAFEDLENAVKHNLRLTVYSMETVRRLGSLRPAYGKTIPIHIKTETGTHRQGVPMEEVLPFIKEVNAQPTLTIEGISSHFANIEDTTDHSYARYQLKNFQEVCEHLDKEGIEIPVKHIACTAAVILFPETLFDMVRVGIGLYGLWPSKETYVSCLLRNRDPSRLKPVLSWKTRIAQLKKIPKGAYIGYGCTYRTTRETLLGVLPVGYYDGYSRAFSNVSHVLIKGQRAPVRGRVAMDFTMVDVTDIPGLKEEDEVVLIGKSGEERITADALASFAGTINYEIVARINPQIPRIVL